MLYLVKYLVYNIINESIEQKSLEIVADNFSDAFQKAKEIDKKMLLDKQIIIKKLN